MRCANCNAELKPGKHFCVRCGAKLDTSSIELTDKSQPASSFMAKTASRRPWIYVAGGLAAVAILGGLTVLGYQFLSRPTRTAGSTSSIKTQQTSDATATQPQRQSSDANAPTSESNNTNAHTPRISDLVVLEQSSAAQADIVFNVFDEAGDVASDGGSVGLAVVLSCGEVEVVTQPNATRVEMKDAKNGRVYASLLRPPIPIPAKICNLLVSMKDKAGNESNQLIVPLTGNATEFCPMEHRLDYNWYCKVMDEVNLSGKESYNPGWNRLILHFNKKTREVKLSIDSPLMVYWLKHPFGQVSELKDVSEREIKFGPNSPRADRVLRIEGVLLINGETYPIVVERSDYKD